MFFWCGTPVLLFETSTIINFQGSWDQYYYYSSTIIFFGDFLSTSTFITVVLLLECEEYFFCLKTNKSVYS